MRFPELRGAKAKRVFAALCGALCGVAAWTTAGALAVDTSGGSLRLVGLLPSLTTVAIAVVFGAAIAVWRTSRDTPARLFLLPVISALPWTTIASWPGLVAWAGPAAIFPFALLIIGIVVSTLVRSPILRRVPDGTRGAWLAGMLSAMWLGLTTTATMQFPVTGDEPHYLLAAQSLLTDGDLDLANNYDDRSYQSFYAGSLEPRHVVLGVLAQQFSFHGPALSMLILPGFALGGVLGARLLLLLVTAVGAGFLWSAARMLTGSPAAAWAGWAALMVSAPFAFHGVMLYPDGVAAAIASLALWVLIALARGKVIGAASVVAAGLALATLPWLHIRLSLAAGVFGLALLWSLAQRRRDLVLPFMAAPVISFVLWIASTWIMFGTTDPTAIFRTRVAGSLSGTPVGMLGLLFDVEFGMFPYAPVMALAALGVATTWRHSRFVTLVSVGLALATLVMGASWTWWGGDSPPARFLVPVMPLLALWLATWWAGAAAGARSLIGVATVISACLTVLMAYADHGSFIVNSPDGQHTIFEWLSPNVDLSLAFPSWLRPGIDVRSEGSIAALWILAGAIGLAGTIWLQRSRRHEAQTGWLVASTMVILSMTSGASLAWWQRGVMPWTPDRGQLRMLHAATSPELSIGVQGSGWHEVDGRPSRTYWTTRDSALSSLRIATPVGAGTAVRLHVPFVPAGRYTIEVEQPLSAIDQASPRLSLELGRDALPFATWFASSGEQAPSFALALPIWAVRVVSDSAQDPMSIVRLRPQLVIAPPPRVDGYPLRAIRYGSLVVYSLDPYTFAAWNGLGLAPGRQGSVIITGVDGQPASYVLQLESESATATVTFEQGSFKRTVSVKHGARERVPVPVATALMPLRFVVEGESWVRDGRRLGAFVRVFPE